MSYSRNFLWRWFLSCLVILCSVAGTNYFIDPYGLFGSPRMARINATKPAAGDRVRVVKPYEVDRVKPGALITGNSRPEMGLDPEHSCWQQVGRPVYNLATPGGGPYFQVRNAQHALANNPIKAVVIGLDFLDFLQDPDDATDPHQWPPAVKSFERRLRISAEGERNPSYFWQSIKDKVEAAYSLSTFVDSLVTFASQSDVHASTRTDLGFNPALDYLKLIQTEGQWSLVAQKEEEVLTILSGKDWSLYHKDSQWSTDLEALRRLIIDINDRGAKAVLFINPYHADYLQSIYIAGMWPLLEEWKRVSTELAHELGDVPLWDFNGFNAYTTELPPEKGDKENSMRWFWEPAHYKKELGDLMLVRMFSEDFGRCSTRVDDVGVRLSVKNIDSHLTRLRAARRSYVMEHPNVVVRLQAILDKLNSPSA